MKSKDSKINRLALNGSDWEFFQLRTGPFAERQVETGSHYYDTELNRLVPRLASSLAQQRPQGGLPDLSSAKWRKCSVPGSVQSALIEAGEAAEPVFHGLNIQSLQTATVNRETFFRKIFPAPSDWQGRTVWLCFGSIDYEVEIFLNGHHVGGHRGHYSPFSFEVSGILEYRKNNTLIIRFASFPQERSRTARPQILNNRISDCTPAVCPLGICGDVFLRSGAGLILHDIWIRPRLSPAFDRANLDITLTFLTGAPPTGTLTAEVTVFSPDQRTLAVTRQQGELAAEGTTWQTRAEISDPELWWPNGHGSQPLYSVLVRILNEGGQEMDGARQSFGIRRIALVKNDPPGEPALPWVLEVNGRKVYLKGGGWPPMDCLYRNQVSRYEHFLRHAAAAHMNCIRWWGGGIAEPPCFYELCDRLGLMIVHDFFMANENFDTPEFLQRIIEDGEGFVRTRRNHPSLVMWNGGNELNYRYTKSAIAQATAAALLAKMDPDRPVVPSTPCTGLGQTHSITPYNYRPREDYQNAILSQDVLAMEGNSAAIANISCLEKILPEPEFSHFDPESPSPSFLQHNGLANWGGFRWNWLGHETTRWLFGEIPSLDLYVTAAQISRAECLAFGVEEFRRSKFRRSGTLVWQLIECWPNAAGNALIDWYGLPKASYDYLKRSFAPVAVSLRFSKIFWSPGETWQAELWIANDTMDSFAGSVSVDIWSLDGKPLWRTRLDADAPANGAQKVGELAWPIPEDFREPFVILLAASEAGNGEAVAHQQYLHSSRCVDTHPFSPLIDLAKAPMAVDVRGTHSDHNAKVILRNTGSRLLFGVRLSLPERDGRHPLVLFSDNHFHLPPQTEKILEITSAGNLPDFSGLCVSALNMAPVSVAASAGDKQ